MTLATDTVEKEETEATVFALVGELCLVVLPMAAPDGAAPAMLDEWAAEAAGIRNRQPEKWRQYETVAGEVFEENKRRTAGWTNRSAPPRPNLEPLKLPLAFLVDRMLSEPPPLTYNREITLEEERLLRSQRDGHTRHEAYFSAIIQSDDERRIAALCEYRKREQALAPPARVLRRWNSLLAEAANREWALSQLNVIAPDASPTAPIEDDLVYCLAKRFADELPPNLRGASYSYLFRCPNIKPRHPDYRPWDVLFRLDVARARKDILPYFYNRDGGRDSRQTEQKAYIPSYNLATIHLLREFAGESPELAQAVRQWLASRDVFDYDKPALRGILLRADPAHELQPDVQRLDSLLAEQKRTGERFGYDQFGGYGGDVGDLLHAMTKINSPDADRATARFVHHQAIDAGLRFLLLESLVRHRYEELSEVMARWLRDERSPWPDHLRKDAAEHWGEFGREALEKAEQLNSLPSRS